jgi:DNA-directed RNA polymerase subunit H (RpoH/RPB5)
MNVATSALVKGIVFSLCCMLLYCGCCPALQECLTDETGFEGAVTVLSIDRDGSCDVALVRVPYLDIYRKPKEGRARVVVDRDHLHGGALLPAFCHVHYEMGVDGSKKWAERGWAAFTAVYNEDAPIAVSPGDGNNLARAIIQWARRCPFVNPARLHLDGGSQGGYMVLAMSADMFPVTSATADAPVVNWAYNFAYFEANRPLITGYSQPFDAPLPVMAAVMPLADMAYEHFGTDLADDAWYYVSPISKIQYITHPIMVLIGTGDMLVPMDQISRVHIHDCTFEGFPEGYQRDFDAVTRNEKSRTTLEDLLPPERVFTYMEPRQENSYVISLNMRLGKEEHPSTKPSKIDRKWSPDHQWNLYYLDDGCVLPYSDHFTHAWDTSPDTFVAHYRDVLPDVDILTEQKLSRLLERYENEMSGLPNLKNGEPVNRRNYDAVERRDVISGLRAYANMGEAHQERLETLYQQGSRKPFGPVLDSDQLDALVSSVAELQP